MVCTDETLVIGFYDLEQVNKTNIQDSTSLQNKKKIKRTGHSLCFHFFGVSPFNYSYVLSVKI